MPAAACRFATLIASNQGHPRKGVLITFTILSLCCVSHARALDIIKSLKGPSLNGTIEAISPREVTLKLSNGTSEKIPVNLIESIRFSGEPPQLNVARLAALAGRYEDALRVFDKLAADGKGLDRPEVQQDLHYFQALCAAKLALSGTGDILAAGKQMRDFVQKNHDSYHFLEASEILGDLLSAVDKPDLAKEAYAAVERGAPWNDVKIRSRVAQGYALLAQDKGAEALATFEGALKLAGDDDSPLIVEQRQAATLGKAAALAATGKSDEGIKLVEEVIAVADPERAELYARAYNTLGTCLRKTGRKKEALLAFLHVDILYPSYPLAHAEALQNLTQLWPEVGNPQRAAEAQEILKSRYANTRWGKG